MIVLLQNKVLGVAVEKMLAHTHAPWMDHWEVTSPVVVIAAAQDVRNIGIPVLIVPLDIVSGFVFFLGFVDGD